MYTDYSLAVWNEKKELVTVAKAYSGLTDKEIAEFDRFVRKNITGRFGPVRSIRPEMVFELPLKAFRIQVDTRQEWLSGFPALIDGEEIRNHRMRIH